MNTLLMTVGMMIVYLVLMLAQEYFGTFLAIVVGAIAFCVWAISHIVEWIQPSRVNRKYYQFILAGWLAPLFALIAFVGLRGEISWLS